MKNLILAGLACALAGCVTPQPVEPPPPVAPAPICKTKPQCDAMWVEAMQQLQNLTGLRLQLATDQFAQTFGSFKTHVLSGSAKKIPQPDGTTIIAAEFYCRYSCDNLNFRALNLFNVTLVNAGSAFDVR
jgi:hypothetical protein